MSIDSYYEIGGAHIVCQDYALHGQFDDLSYVIISDGCSSAEYPEIGAQILCHVAKYYLTLYYQAGLFKECSMEALKSVLGNSILKRVDDIRKLYPITTRALEATLLMTAKIGLTTYVFCWGDGVIIEKYKSVQNQGGHYNITTLNYSKNAPFYLVTDREKYIKEMEMGGINDPKIVEKIYRSNVFNANGENFFDEFHHRFDEVYAWKYEDSASEYLESITVCSDGILSYKDKDKKIINIQTMVKEFTDFKSTGDGFTKRRMNFLKKKCQDENWSHYDDISCGTIFVKMETGTF